MMKVQLQKFSGMRNSYRNIRHKNLRALSTPAGEPKPFESVPGLSKLPVVGSLHHFLPGIGSIGAIENFFIMTDTFHKKFGPVVKFNIFSRATMVLLFEPDDFDQVYRAEDATNTPLRPGSDIQVHYRTTMRKNIFEGVYGLITAQGPQWREFRTKVNPALLKIKLLKLYAPGINEIAQEMTDRLIKLDSKYLDFNFDLEMTKFSLESIAFVGLGARLGCLREELGDDHPAMRLITSAKEVLQYSLKLEMSPVQFYRYFSTPMHKKLINAFDTQWNLSAMYIAQARKVIKERGHDVPDEDKSIIEKLLAIDEKVAIMMANEMLLAGIDTVAFSSTSVLYELAKNPHTQDKLREEIRSGDPNKRYLKACVKEALRLHPVISANLRRTSKEHVVAGYRIPEGVDVIAPNEYLCRLEKYFPRPLEFIPERWLTDKNDPLYYGNSHPMIYLPFGFGIRMCIGRRIAELEIEALVQSVVGGYKVKWEGPPIKVTSMIMNSYAKPYYFRFEAAK